MGANSTVFMRETRLRKEKKHASDRAVLLPQQQANKERKKKGRELVSPANEMVRIPQSIERKDLCLLRVVSRKACLSRRRARTRNEA